MSPARGRGSAIHARSRRVDRCRSSVSTSSVIRPILGVPRSLRSTAASGAASDAEAVTTALSPPKTLSMRSVEAPISAVPFRRMVETPDFALVGLQHVGDGGKHDQRREELVLGDLERERPRRAAIGSHRDGERNGARAHAEGAGDGGGAILVQHAHHLTQLRELDGVEQARNHRHDVRARHRQLRRAEVEEGVAEGEHARALDARHGAGGAERQVAAHEADADGVTGLKRARSMPRRSPRRPSRCRMPEPPPETGAKPAAANVSDNHAPIGVEKPAIESGVAIGRRTGLLTVSRPSPRIEAGDTFDAGATGHRREERVAQRLGRQRRVQGERRHARAGPTQQTRPWRRPSRRSG